MSSSLPTLLSGGGAAGLGVGVGGLTSTALNSGEGAGGLTSTALNSDEEEEEIEGGGGGAFCASS